MAAGEESAFRRWRRRAWILAWWSCFAGCATDHGLLDLTHSPRVETEGPAAPTGTDYSLACPDVLELAVDGLVAWTGKREIGPDGRIDLGRCGRLRIEGLSLEQARQLIARTIGVAPDTVHARVSEYRSRQIFVAGQVPGSPLTLPYRGPETVVDVLKRVGGLTPGAAVEEVYVVRHHIAEGTRPEVFRIDVRAILVRHDSRTNLAIQPLDQIFVGQTRPYSLEKCVAPWLRPLYEAIWGLNPASQQGSEPETARARAASRPERQGTS